MTSPNPAWKRIDSFSGQNPKPRHGHRGIAPPTKGDIPTGCAAFGFATDGTKVLVFGGMVEYGKYSSELMELNPAKWEWKKLKPRASRNSTVPCARLGHSLTFADGKYYLFGGLANDSKDPKQNIPRYLNDLYSLECKTSSSMWDQPVARGTPPIARESHTCIYHLGQLDCRPKLIIYGGMNGNRLGDLWCFYLDFSQWTQITPSGIIPQPRSLHTSVVLGHRMFVFGGWVPLVSSEDRFTNEKEWKCTNTLSAYNLGRI
ncbi:unnamed protein product [Didymodactylos carnosus]|uniref:Host cell factor Kelch-repeats domain-containing protein n=1 Tax=Didymodactylos carnosus TaxID=1234261 RepID=A0A8S2FEN3_9BILA|nr:unnamed protein product [Didymodactylos carnosus]CAF4237091.1 unnamed protein product [Didymodactylos carnosus]